MKNPSKYLVDTNVFLRVFIRENEQAYRDCCQLLEAIKRGELAACVHQLVLVEILWTLQSVYKQKKAVAIQLVESVANLHGIDVVSDFDQRKSLQLYQKFSVKYIDACLAAINEVQQKKWAIVSYDADFKKLPVLWVGPGDLT